MIKNIIFDMGNVLIEFQPDIFLKRMGVNDVNDRNIILNNSVFSSYWMDYDLGLFNMKELINKCLLSIPDYLKRYAKELIRNWHKYSNAIEGMSEYIQSLKDRSYRLYILSNAGYNMPFYIKRFPYNMFDGKIVSAYYHIKKPDKKIYKLILNKYKLNISECIFVDDTKENVDSAKEFGMKAICFKDVDKLKKELEGLL